MLPPAIRRSLSYSAAGILGCAAVRQLSHGSLNSAHLLAMTASGSILIPTLIRNNQWFGPVQTRFETTQKKVWITIDDGPDPDETPGILDVLDRHGAKATFFVVGIRVRRWPDLTRRIVRSGHSLQNHTHHHAASSFWCAPPWVARREIELCGNAIFETTGIRPALFRVPVGFGNPFVHAAAQRAGMKLLGWSASGWDGIVHDPEKVVSRILSELLPGAIILLHDGKLKGMAPGSRAATLEKLLICLKSEGYETTIPKC
jgi:peptidoglycan-N-acetylglucosamine deacetylase